MGYICHHAIIVTGSYDNWTERAQEKALALLDRWSDGRPHDLVGPISPPVVNGYTTFCIYPDGSKEMWSGSEAGDLFREEFVGWLRAQRYEDGSTPLAWVEVQYGDDGFDTRVLADSDEEMRRLYPPKPDPKP